MKILKGVVILLSPLQKSSQNRGIVVEKLLSATAVTRLEDGKIILATIQNGLFMQEDNKWRPIFIGFQKRIRDLHSNGNMIYGVGDEGIFICSMDGGRDWEVKRFPTKASSWSVCSNEDGVVIAHGDKTLYISKNFGSTWETIYPFHMYGEKAPSIRSLFLHEHILFIGTKIHPIYGGIWAFNLENGEIKRIRIEQNHMISSMIIYHSYLVAASGSCRGNKGRIVFSEIDAILQNRMLHWQVCHNDCNENSYLDLSVDQDVLYTTSTQNEVGKSTVCRIFLENSNVKVCGSIQGHGWRIVNQNEDYIVAGSGESKVMRFRKKIG